MLPLSYCKIKYFENSSQKLSCNMRNIDMFLVTKKGFHKALNSLWNHGELKKKKILHGFVTHNFMVTTKQKTVTKKNNPYNISFMKHKVSLVLLLVSFTSFG